MRNLLSNISSLIVILFCVSILIVSEDSGPDTNEMIDDTKNIPGAQSERSMTPRTMIFKRVQSVKISKGVLIFTTFENKKFKSHYFKIRDKNVIFVRDEDSDMPVYSIKFTDSGCNALVVTIPNSLKIDLLEQMKAT